MAAVAAEAGVSKPTIYLRFPTKAELATAAVCEFAAQDPPPETGDIKKDLVAQLGHMRESVEGTISMSLVGTILAEETHHPELLKQLRYRVIEMRRTAVAHILRSGIKRGDIAADTDVCAGVDLLVGSYYSQRLAHDSVRPSWPEDVVNITVAALRP